MNKKRFSQLAICLAVPLGLATLPAQADIVSFDQALTEVSNATSATLNVSPYASGETTGSTPAGDFYVGLTLGSLTVGNFTSDPFYMYCVDFNDEIGVPTSYTVDILNLAGDPSTTPDPNPPGLGETLGTLQLQAILGAGFGTTPSGDAITDSAIQEDIWNLSAPSTPFAPPSPDMSSDLGAAETAFSANTVSFSDAYFLDITDSPNGGQQAFMPVDSLIPNPGGGNSNPITPEPATFGLMSLALAGLGGAFYRKKQRGSQS